MRDLAPAIQRYARGEPYTSIAVDYRMPGGNMRALLVAAGVTIRTRSDARAFARQPAEHVAAFSPPTPKPCVYNCGRMASAWTTRMCRDCALRPPCRCGSKARPERRYMGSWLDGRCGLLIRTEG